ncbi:DEAD/DEAH box helicase [Schaalia sp. Marseille-Q2122]|uniref:DEAD/DEAH box helicase n=1 Tax=Schaalia sp. Marseille-Q2122 TaxID=2736604 RepID=UPI00158ED803|nr:DEAD/DEAH box helicase [Schaalia sp. Marseille-Q2122]
MNRGPVGSTSGPQRVSASAAQNLSPSFPERARWGTAGSLRAWQAAALNLYLEKSPKDFLAVATPGAGKTTFALRIAVELMGSGIVDKVTVVCPTEHLKSQWADAAARVGIHIDPAFSNSQGMAGSHYDGVAVTYAQVASNPAVHSARTRAHRTLIILDEIHHAGDSLSWGDGISEAFKDATRRLNLTGTPFRSDTSPIPFVRYVEDEEGIRRSQADYTYGYGDALRDGVVRPVLFMSYSGTMSWRTSAGEQYSARLGEPLTKDMMKQAWRTALDPKGEWIPAVLQAADQRLTEVRRQVPDAGGLVIASDQTQARAYARHLRMITGKAATVVLSDDKDASERIDTFRENDDRWMVAVRMVSEGVDVPRLSVGVYATNTSTSLFFAQAVGRFVRARRRGETATVFIPSVLPLLDLAGAMEVERDHALDRPTNANEEGDLCNPEDALIAQANRQEKASSDLLGSFEALGADAEFDAVLFDGAAWGSVAEVGSVEEQEYLGIPGLLEPDQVTTLLRARQEEQIASQKRARAAAKLRDENSGISDHRVRAAKRKELQNLVSSWSRRSGETHAVIHSQLRQRCGGPEVAQASTEQIAARIALLREWFVGRR